MQTVTIDGMAHHNGQRPCHLTSTTFSKHYKLSEVICGRLCGNRYYQINGNGKGYQIWRLIRRPPRRLGKTVKVIEVDLVCTIFNYVDSSYK